MSILELHIPTKKASRQNSSTSLNNAITQTTVPQNLEDLKPSFYNEISDMMRGFGDCASPLRESVQLVEKIVQEQMRGIMSDAINASIKRRGIDSPSLVDFEFLMRMHPIKINRMRKYIEDMRLLRRTHYLKTGATQALVDENDPNRDSDEDAEIEVIEKYDEEKMRRLFRADRISQILNGIDYQRYCECRRTSFDCRNSESMRLKFRKFLSIPDEIRLKNLCLTCLSYLVHETVAAVVDLAILTRLNSENRTTEPYSRITSGDAYGSMIHFCPEVTQGRGLEGVKAITVAEIQEAMRRFALFSTKPMGFQRNAFDSRKRYLAM